MYTITLCITANIIDTQEGSHGVLASCPVSVFLCNKRGLQDAQKRWWGRCTGALVKFRKRGLQSPILATLLSYMQWICKKINELKIFEIKDFSQTSVNCFMETLLKDTISNIILELPGLQLSRADWSTDLCNITKEEAPLTNAYKTNKLAIMVQEIQKTVLTVIIINYF